LKESKSSPNYYAAVIVINSDGQVLLGKRKEDGIWTSPAGGSNPGEENPAKTAVRELFEEAGIAANVAWLQPVNIVPTRNGKLCHVFLYVCGSNVMTTSKLDPDEEVGKWKWFSMDQIPNGLKEDERRFTSVREAYMKFYGIQKSLVDTLEKGGKPAMVGEVRNFGGKDYQKLGNGEWKPVVLKEEKQLEAEQNKNKVVSLAEKLKNKISEKKEILHSEKHLHDIKNQAVIEGQQTRSEKPMFTSVDAALAHGYEATDFREVGNFFYDRAQKMAENISKLEQTKQQVDPNFEKIKKENLRISRAFLGQANRIDDRQAKVKKSVVSMGHADAAEINTADYAIDRKMALQTEWLDRIQNVMAGYEYGNEPRVILMDKGELYLVKVNDGLYSGLFKTVVNTDDGQMIDNAKVRIERMTLPSLVQFCLAKEWIEAFKELSPADQSGMAYAAQMDYYGGALEASDRQDKTIDNLIVKLENPQPEVPPTSGSASN
jgi:8-oxo-dGTP pyrophosphatase MutT (NUDIX family)